MNYLQDNGRLPGWQEVSAAAFEDALSPIQTERIAWSDGLEYRDRHDQEPLGFAQDKPTTRYLLAPAMQR